MRTTLANPFRTVIAGQIVDLDDKEAQSLIKGGFAEAVGDNKIAPTEAAVVPMTEIAAAKNKGRKP